MMMMMTVDIHRTLLDTVSSRSTVPNRNEKNGRAEAMVNPHRTLLFMQ